MTALLHAIILMLSISSILTSSFVTVSATQSNSIDLSVSTGFGEDLKSRMQDLISDALNDTDNITNSSTLLGNLSNLSSSNILISKNKITSIINSNDSDSSSSSSIIKDQVKTINGVCTSTKVGGNGNDTLASSGNCNDELTGGPGADKFQCGEGNDTIKDYNPKEGDTILDQQDCEKTE
jgi:hypothetical protein